MPLQNCRRDPMLPRPPRARYFSVSRPLSFGNSTKLTSVSGTAILACEYTACGGPGETMIPGERVLRYAAEFAHCVFDSHPRQMVSSARRPEADSFSSPIPAGPARIDPEGKATNVAT